MPTPIHPRAAELLRGARHVAVLTGAGMSAESGIPTFRDALTGLWAEFDAEELATPRAFERNPALVWRWYAERREAIRHAIPHAGYDALARLARLVPKLTLITQNVDGLHHKAGSPDVIELHGNILRVKCAGQGHQHTRWEETETPPPRCHCGALLRPDVVWFGEMLPQDAVQRAWAAAESCDLFLSIGTSNLVEPAASLPWIAHRRRTPVLVINPDTEGQRAGEGIHFLMGKAGDLLPDLVRQAFPEPASSTSPATDRSLG